MQKLFHFGMHHQHGVTQDVEMKLANPIKTEFSTANDFCSIFEKQMASLYQLAFLLAADHEAAQQIFVAALEECQNENSVFRGRADSWAKRVMVLNAIRVIAPSASQATLTEVCEQVYDGQSRLEVREEAITRLSPFTRFAFIMNVLEKFSVVECAVLLRSTRDDVIQARTQALLAVSFEKPTNNEPEFVRAARVLAADYSDAQPARSRSERSNPQFCEICA